MLFTRKDHKSGTDNKCHLDNSPLLPRTADTLKEVKEGSNGKVLLVALQLKVVDL